jgi:purine-nucleoside phosphorylase
MAAICLEKIIAMGATQIILYGWCGSLTPSLRIGDLFMPTSSLSEEGTSVHYQHIVAEGDDSLHISLLDVLTTNAVIPKQGAIWTTDAVYRETRDKVAKYASQGIAAVDMEYTALKAVAGFRHVNFAAVMLVSDELYHQEWSPRFVQKSFRSDSKRILDRLCTLIQFIEVVPT